MKILKYITFVILIFWISSCKKFMEPEPDASIRLDYVEQSQAYFKGVIYKVYKGLPTRVSLTYEAATDNAVVNSESDVSSKAARGGLSTQNNPFGDVWTTDYNQINIINWYIGKMVLDPTKTIPTPVKFDINPLINMQMFYFTLGEAYFLRAWYQLDLLKYYGGVVSDGKAYGFPITTKYLQVGDQLDLPRNSYKECVDRIAADCDSAFKYLPLTYSKTSGFISDGLQNDAGHASGIGAKALKARAYLYAASPAYNPGNDPALWNLAAQSAADAITAIGADNLLAYSAYFNKNNLNNKNYSNKDIFFRGPITSNSTTYESENYPPRAFSGQGTYNPTQNLVNAFPMIDGYPLGSSPTKPYDPTNMVLNRDPRLDLFIVRNQEVFAKITLNTQAGGLDAYGSDPNATRSGYYLQKLLDPTVSLESGKVVSTTYAAILFGRPELYLNFAEAAINATGNPDDKKFGYSAREILAKVRDRALGAGKDLYLPLVTTREAFLELVKNERRVELCFEDHRFWDLRRWCRGVSDISTLNSPVYGIYSTSPLETRSYKSPYMPMPYSELLKTKNLVNNAGW